MNTFISTRAYRKGGAEGKTVIVKKGILTVDTAVGTEKGDLRRQTFEIGQLLEVSKLQTRHTSPIILDAVVDIIGESVVIQSPMPQASKGSQASVGETLFVVSQAGRESLPLVASVGSADGGRAGRGSLPSLASIAAQASHPHFAAEASSASVASVASVAGVDAGASGGSVGAVTEVPDYFGRPAMAETASIASMASYAEAAKVDLKNGEYELTIEGLG